MICSKYTQALYPELIEITIVVGYMSNNEMSNVYYTFMNMVHVYPSKRPSMFLKSNQPRLNKIWHMLEATYFRYGNALK